MENTAQIPMKGILLYTVMGFDNVDASGVPQLNLELKKFSYDLDNMEDTYVRFSEIEDDVKKRFPSTLLHAKYLEKMWDMNNINPNLTKVVEIIREWGKQ